MWSTRGKSGAVSASKVGMAAVAAVLLTMSTMAGGQTTRPVSAAAAGTADENPHVWKPKVTSVAVFKNGLGFFFREGDVELRDGWCLAKEIPPATFGTLAIYSHAQDQVVDVVNSGPGETVEFDGRDAPKTVEARRQRLTKYVDLKVSLTYEHDKQTRSAAGTLRSVEARFAVVESESNSFAVPIEEIARVQVLELPLRAHVSAEGDKPAEKARLGMAYLRKGITWIPEYTLKILDDETAELSLRGTLVNEAEDLIHTDVSFVVGVPHFVHTEYMAPVAIGQTIRMIGASVAPSQVMSQAVMNRAQIVSNLNRDMDVMAQPVAPPAGDIGRTLSSLPQMDGAGATDYTVYTKKDLTVRQGEKAIVTLFRAKIRYSHVYRWDLPGDMQHLLVLQNPTDTAWTTGPCLVVSGDRPLSEDLLKYTPKGGTGEIPVTTAINIAQVRTEKEIERKLKVHEPSPNFWVDLVTVDGEVSVRNFEKRPATIVIRVPVSGKPLKVSDNGNITVDTTKLQLLERNGWVQWTVTLEAGASKTLTYTYERYVPSR